MKKLLLLVTLLCGLTSIGWAQPTITSLSPSRNAVNVAANANIDITFSTDMDALQVIQPNDVIVHGSFRGRYAVAISYNAGSRILTVNPDSNFYAGEKIDVTILQKQKNGEFVYTSPQLLSFTVASSGTGVGAFTSGTVSTIGSSYPVALQAADVNNDGKLDYAVIRSGDYYEIHRNLSYYDALEETYVNNYPVNSYGQFSGFNLSKLIMADFDLNYKIDVAFLTKPGGSGVPSVKVDTNYGLGAFATAGNITVTDWNTYSNTSLIATDVDRDGYYHVLVSNSDIDGVGHIVNDWPGATFSTGGTSGSILLDADQQIITGDFNNDGVQDYAGYNYSKEVLVLLSNGFSGYHSVDTYLANENIGRIEPADVTGDSYLDIVLGHSSDGSVSVLENDQDGTFTLSESYPLAGAPGSKLRTGDMDGDGDIDLVYANQSRLYTVFNNGSGEFTYETSFYTQSITDLVIADVDRDGDLDVAAVRNGSNSINLYYNSNSFSEPQFSSSFNSFSNNWGTSIEGSLNVGSNFSFNVLIVAKAGSSISATPVDGTFYEGNSTYGSGATLSDGSYVVFNGALGQNSSIKNFSVDGLTTGTTYYFDMYYYSGVGSATNYRSTASASTNVTTSSQEGYDFKTSGGRALSFDGSTYGSFSMTTVNSPFTIELWVKPSVINTDQVFLIYGEEAILLGLGADNKFYAGHENGGGTRVELQGTTTAALNAWYHIALTGTSGDNLKLYVNGELEDSDAITTATVTNTPWYIGVNWNEDKYYTGAIDEIRYWSVARSAADIRATMYVPPTGFPANLEHYWQFAQPVTGEEDAGFGINRYDKINSLFMNINGYEYVESDVPFGNGTISSASAVTTGSTALGNVTLTLAEDFDSAVDVQVLEVATVPTNMPAGYSFSVADRYFIIDIFGDPGTFSANLTLTLGADAFSAEELADPSLLKLYKRSSTSVGSWTLAASGISAENTSGQVVFNGITSFSQFVVTSGEPFYLLSGVSDTTINVNVYYANESEPIILDNSIFPFAEGYEDSTLILTVNDNNFSGELYLEPYDNSGDRIYSGGSNQEGEDVYGYTFNPSTNVLEYWPYEAGIDQITITFAASKGNASITVNFAVIDMNPEFVGTADENEWQMLSNPFQSPLGTFLDSVWTQGAANSDAPAGDANLFTFNEETAQWETITTDLNSTTLAAGKGLLAYMFADDNPTDEQAPVDGGWPKTFNYSGTTFGTEATITLKNVDVDESGTLNGNEGWVLVGNPFGFGVDAGDILYEMDDQMSYYDEFDEWQAVVNEYVYVWDPSTNAWVESDWGTLTPYQSMFLRILEPGFQDDFIISDYYTYDGTTIIDAGSGGGGGGEEWKARPNQNEKQSTPKFMFTLNQVESGLSSKFGLSFSENGKYAIDGKDAYYLWPLNNTYANMYMKVSDQAVKINNLPALTEESFSYPIYLDATVTGEFNLTWDPTLLPEGFEATLVEVETGNMYTLKDNNQITFRSNVVAKQSVSSKKGPNAGLSIASTTDAPVLMLKVNPIATSVEKGEQLPTEVELNQSFPNPFNPSTTIRFGVPQQTHVRLEVYDILGRRISILMNETKSAGRYNVTFNAQNLASGVYFYRLSAGSKVITKQMTLIK
ncbi:T9SS type A sorting domain-containing protein [bacterium]|nr:MAG: T9SS type A sorting domain-containing protein [bacterium]